MPALNVPPLPKVTLVTPFTSARPVTSTLVAAASVIAPVESRSALAASLSPAKFMPESSAITTAPVDWNVSVPALNVPPLPKVTLVTPFTSARPVTSTLVAAASVIAPVESRSALAASLSPARFMPESSAITTAPVDWNASVPALNVPPLPKVTLVTPFTSARPVTSTLVAAASVIAPVESRSALAASLSPARFMPESSAITTAPVDWNVSVPALNVPPLPKVTLVTPFTSARPVTSTLVAAASVIAPVESRSALAASLSPARFMPESSAITTAPVDWNVSVPKFVVSATLSPSVMAFVPAFSVARPMTSMAVATLSVMFPPDVTVRLPAVEMVLKFTALVSTTVALFADRMATSVPKSFAALSRVKLFAMPALNVAVPETCKAPASSSIASAVTVNVARL